MNVNQYIEINIKGDKNETIISTFSELRNSGESNGDTEGHKAPPVRSKKKVNFMRKR